MRFHCKSIGRALVAAACVLAVSGEAWAAAAAPGAPAAGRAAPRATAAAESVNINTADAETIADVLVGVGPAKAEAIVNWRKSHGAFKSLEQLREVQGISARTLERNRGRIQLR